MLVYGIDCAHKRFQARIDFHWLYLPTSLTAELGLALIASKNSRFSDKRLVQLLRYRLDGGLATDFTCYVIAKGNAVEGALKTQVPDKLHADCLDDVRRLVARTGKLFEGFNPASVCRDPQQIAEKRREVSC